MANSKKVQQEIDRQLRRTQDGIDSYEELYGKFLKASTQTQKERLEADLKKEIKKLQRFRDTIKGFIANPEVKDTKALESYQRNIEEKMEVFKACERETKTKAFSKEGLAASSPHETPQAHTEAWLKSAMEDARKQIEIIEYDVERNTRGHHGRSKNAASVDATRLQKLRFHLGKLERLLKAVINGDVDLDEVGDIEDRVHKFLQRDANNGADDDEEEECMYSMFDLEDSPFEKQRTGGSGADVDDSPSSGQQESQRNSLATSLTTTTTRASSQNAPKKAMQPVTLGKVEAAKSSTGTTQVGPRTENLLSSPSAKAAASRDQLPDAGNDTAGLLDDDMDKANTDTFGDEAMNMTAPGSLADMAKATSGLSRMGDWEKGRPASLAMPAVNSSASASPNTATAAGTAANVSSLVGKTLPTGQPATVMSSAATTTPAVPTSAAVTAATTTTTPPPPPTTTVAAQPSTTSPSQQQQQQQRVAEHRQTSNENAVSSSHSTSAPSYDEAMMLQLVEMSLANLPHTQDVDRQRPFEPSNPTTCPSYYPQQVLPALASHDIYSEFELETLFFIFYYHQNTYQQYYAAKQIKAHSFRYHTKLNTWFKRKGHLKESQEGSERGSFIYFNYEDTSKIEEKEDFTFDYQYLEDQLH